MRKNDATTLMNAMAGPFLSLLVMLSLAGCGDGQHPDPEADVAARATSDRWTDRHGNVCERLEPGLARCRTPDGHVWYREDVPTPGSLVRDPVKAMMWLFSGGRDDAADGSNTTTDDTGARADANQVYNWKMVTTWPANFPVFQEGAELFAENVRVMSNGRLDIQVFAGGELVPALQAFDAVSQGAVEMGHGAAYYWAGKVPAAQFFSTVPFGMGRNGMETWLRQGGGLELWNELYEPFNLVAMPIGNTSMQMGGWFNKKITSVADLKGLRMRIPGLGGKVLERAGGNPVLMAAGELYTALERGAIDATEWVGPLHDLRLGLNRAANYYYYPGWHEPGTELELLVNRTRWESLPEDLQRIVEQAAAATSVWTHSAMEYRNSQALEELYKKKNVQVLPFPPDVLRQLRAITTETLSAEAGQDPDFKRVFEAYEAFRKEYQSWHTLASQAPEDSPTP